MNWIAVKDKLPEDAECVWVLNKRRKEMWEHEFDTQKYEYIIYDAFFERCRGWVIMHNACVYNTNICFWSHKDLPEEI